MKKLLTSIALFIMFCALPFIGLLLTKIGYPEFRTNIDFAWGVGCSISLGFAISILYYFENSTNK